MAVNMARGSIKINKDSFNKVSNLIKTKNRTNAHNALNQLNADLDDVLTNSEALSSCLTLGTTLIATMTLGAITFAGGEASEFVLNNGGYGLIGLGFLPLIYAYAKAHMYSKREKELEKEYKCAFGVEYDKKDKNFKAPTVNNYIKM